jgi:hypothetical protein
MDAGQDRLTKVLDLAVSDCRRPRFLGVLQQVIEGNDAVNRKASDSAVDPASVEPAALFGFPVAAIPIGDDASIGEQAPDLVANVLGSGGRIADVKVSALRIELNELADASLEELGLAVLRRGRYTGSDWFPFGCPAEQVGNGTEPVGSNQVGVQLAEVVE